MSSEGCPRMSASMHGFNAYLTPADAGVAARRTLRTRSPYWVWQLDDGLFVWSAIPDPVTPGFPAELVERWPDKPSNTAAGASEPTP